MAFIRMARLTALITVALAASILAGCGKSTAPPLEPDQALKTFHLPDGFRIELVASEPLITDPVEIAFDARGRMFVAEMEDYPAEPAAGGRIMMLEDLDDNGHYETGHLFADSLPYVNGVMPWRQGVLVTSAPHILYLEDTNGDHRADIRTVVLTGFAFTNPQLRMSSLRYGLDNWIYGAYSRAGGQRGYPEFTDHGRALRFPENPRADSADIYPGTDFRFKPDSFLVEPAGGMSQFGNAFDAVGNRFTVWNNIHLRHVVMGARYAARNPALKIPSLMASISDHGDAAAVYSRAENRLDLHESEIGHFTSACGHSIYTGGLFDAPYDGAAFVCEPVSNLVHIDVLKENGATFIASRLDDNSEFLTSTDSWFRPVNTTVGPDGAMYIVDFYRKLVEHPAWIARADEKGIYTHAGVLQEEDFLAGSDRGRIYRIVPHDHRRSPAPALQNAHADTLVSALGHPNMWRRITAQRLLVERQDMSAVSALKTLFTTSESAVAKIHALRTLDGLGFVDEQNMLAALSDGNPDVQRHAVQLAEKWLQSSAVRQRLLSMTEEPKKVQFQIALTLGILTHEESFPALKTIALDNLSHTWLHTAVLSGTGVDGLDWFETVAKVKAGDKRDAAGKDKFLHQIASMIGGSENARVVCSLIALISKDTATQRPALEGLVAGRGQTGDRLALSPDAQEALIAMLDSDNEGVQEAVITLAQRVKLRPSEQITNLILKARLTATDTTVSLRERAFSVRLLALAPQPVNVQVLKDLVDLKQPIAVQVAAARVLVLRDDYQALTVLADRWNSCTAEVRDVIEAGFANSPARLAFFLEAVETRGLDPKLMGTNLRSRLQQSTDPTVRPRAEKLLASLTQQTRESVINAYHESTTLPGNASRGKEVFRSACSPCHQLDGAGRAFGPDLLSVSSQTRINLLTMIIDPNNNIAPGYDGYFIETMEGRTFTGILSGENASGVTLRTADGREEFIARSDIRNMRPMSQSLMPEGLESGISKQQMADLLAYLKRTELSSSRMKAAARR